MNTTYQLIKIAGYHQDNTEYTRLIINHRISKAKAKVAYQSGYQDKLNGVRCGCFTCNR